MSALALASTLLVLSQVTDPPPDPAPQVAPPEWNGTVGLSVIALGGNTESLTINLSGIAERKTNTWRWSAKAAGTYGRTRVEAGEKPTVLALGGNAQLRADRSLSEPVALFGLLGEETDHIKSVEHRPYAETGVAVRWLERKQAERTVLMLRTDLGFRYAYESRFQYYPTPSNLPDVQLLAPRFGLAFRYAVSEHVTVLEEAEVARNVVGPSRTLVTSLSRLQAQLLGPLALSVGLQINYDSAPAEGKVPVDTIFTTGVELGF